MLKPRRMGTSLKSVGSMPGQAYAFANHRPRQGMSTNRFLDRMQTNESNTADFYKVSSQNPLNADSVDVTLPHPFRVLNESSVAYVVIGPHPTPF